MGYLRSVDDDLATGRLKEVYEEIKKARKVKRVSPVLQAFSLNPDVLASLARLTNQVTFGGSSLGRRWEEMLSTAVSAWNHCHY